MNEKTIRTLKLSIIIMTTMIVVGLAIIVTEVVQRSTSPSSPTNDIIAQIPKKSDVRNVFSLDGQIAVWVYNKKDGHQVLTFAPDTAKPIRQIKISDTE